MKYFNKNNIIFFLSVSILLISCKKVYTDSKDLNFKYQYLNKEYGLNHFYATNNNLTDTLIGYNLEKDDIVYFVVLSLEDIIQVKDETILLIPLFNKKNFNLIKFSLNFWLYFYPNLELKKEIMAHDFFYSQLLKVKQKEDDTFYYVKLTFDWCEAYPHCKYYRDENNEVVLYKAIDIAHIIYSENKKSIIYIKRFPSNRDSIYGLPI